MNDQSTSYDTKEKFFGTKDSYLDSNYLSCEKILDLYT